MIIIVSVKFSDQIWRAKISFEFGHIIFDVVFVIERVGLIISI